MQLTVVLRDSRWCGEERWALAFDEPDHQVTALQRPHARYRDPGGSFLVPTGSAGLVSRDQAET
jgi:hypothetical protein